MYNKNNNCGCNSAETICNQCQIPEPCDCPITDLDAKCILFTDDDIQCDSITVITKNLNLSDNLKNLVAYICQRFSDIQNYFRIINVGGGSEIYAGDNLLGQKKLRTLVAGDSIEITENIDTITLDVDLTGLQVPPLEKLDQGNGEGIIIRGRDQDNYLPVGNRAVDLSYSDNAFPLSGATGTNSFTANSKTIASASDSAAFNTANVSEQGSFAVNQSINTGFYAFSWGSGEARGTNSMAGGVGCIAEQQGSVATGTSTKATGFSSNAIGQETEALAPISSASGHLSKTRGNVSYAGGQNNETDSHGETAIGTYGTIQSGNPSDTAFIPTDRLLNVGNGFINPISSVITRSDALTLLKNGLMTLPSVTNSLITAASGKAVVTKEYLVSVLPIIDGSETKINAGTNISITGTGTIGSPYIVNNTLTVDGSETKLNSGITTTVTGNGTTGTPYIVETVNLQKAITADYTLTANDNNYSIKVNNSATPITITVPSGLPANFFVGITQKGSGDVTIAGSGTTITNPIGLKIKSQGYHVGIEQIGSSNAFDLLGFTKS